MFDVAVLSLLTVALNRDAPSHTYGPKPTPAYASPDAAAQPGVIHPANDVVPRVRNDDDHRGFACADKKCKTTTPVYTTQTPLEQEQGRLGGR